MMNTGDVTSGKPIAVLLQSISGVSAINPLVSFYDIHGGKREVLFFYFVPDTTRDPNITLYFKLFRKRLALPIYLEINLSAYICGANLFPIALYFKNSLILLLKNNFYRYVVALS
jgi:hypothetical protein